MNQRLIELEKLREDFTLDFKEKLSFSTDEEKAKMLNDVVAFLNHSGGRLIVGAKESKGNFHSWSPFEVDDHDAYRRQIISIIETGINPKPIGVHIAEFHECTAGKYVFELVVPEGLLKPYQNAKNGAFYLRGDGKNVVLTRDQIKAMFVTVEQLKVRANEVMDRENQEIIRRKLMYTKGCSLRICIVPAEAATDSGLSFSRGERTIKTFSPYPREYSESGNGFVGCANGHEEKDTIADDVSALSRFFIGYDGSVYAAVACPIVVKHGKATVLDFQEKFSKYVTNVLNFMKEQGAKGAFYFTASLQDLHRDEELKLYFPATPKIEAKPVYGNCDDVLAGATAFAKHVYSCSHYGR